MTSQPQTPPKKRPPAGGVAELRMQLAERDRQLAELTEQSLQILDRLAEARESPDERAALHARIGELQELLADTRQRVRTGTRAVLGRGTERHDGFELAIWGLAGDVAAAITAATAGLESVPVVAMLGPDAQPGGAADVATGVSVHETECRSPAHFWNEAMATTHAPVVVLAAPGVRVGAEALGRLVAAAADAGVAIASPAIVCGGSRWLGRGERSLLDLVPHACGITEGLVALPFASPEVFALSRQAYEQLGPFDQDLGGDLALAEWVLRANGHALRCLGVADAVAEATELRAAGGEVAAGENDQLVVLARHRPQQLAAAALAATALWQQEPMALAAVLRAVFRRLPRAAEFAPAIDLLVVQAQTVAGWKRLAPTLRERLIGIAGAMGVAAGEATTEPGLVTLAERLQAMAGILRQRSLELEIRDSEVQAMRQQMHQHDELEQGLRQDIIARSNTIDALRHELLERERAIASLREEIGHRQGERDRLIDHLGSVQQDLDRLHDELTKVAVEKRAVEDDRARVVTERDRLLADVAESRSAAARLEGEVARFADVKARIAELEDRHRDEIERSRELERMLGDAVGRSSERENQLADARVRMERFESDLKAESRRLEEVLHQIDELRGGHESLRREHGTLQEQRVELEARAHELVLALRDRERWLVQLLHEVQNRRLWRREFTPYEAEFLARHADRRP